MGNQTKLKYAIQLRWYGIINYLIVLAEQIALFYYGYMTFFWVALILNIIGMLGLGLTISNIEKNCLV